MKKLRNIFLLTLLLASVCQAQGVLHLNFHMGLGAQGHYFIGGTVENRGNASISHSYIVISLLDEQCYPIGEKLHMLGSLAAQHQHEFRIPIEGQLHGYRLTAIKALDDMGFSLNTVDETQAIIQSRISAERNKCQQTRLAR